MAKTSRITTAQQPRRIKPAPKRFWQVWRRTAHPVKLPNVFALSRASLSIVWANKRLFLGITAVYGLLSLVFVHGFTAGTNVNELKQELDKAFTGTWGALGTGLGTFVVLAGASNGGSTDGSSVYQFFLTIMASLAIIWALRQVYAEVTVSTKLAYYHGMYPLVPFILVLTVIALQLVPLVAGASLYSLAVGNGIVVGGLEKATTLLIFLGLALLSFYWLASSVFALYIVALPNMTPLKALRSARGLTKHRRWTVLRKIVYLPIVLTICAALIMVPIIIVAAPLAQTVFYVLGMIGLAVAHSYLYTLYRELLNE